MVGLCIGGGTGLSNLAVHWASVFGPRLWQIPGVELHLLPAFGAVLFMPIAMVALLVRPLRSFAVGSLVAALVTVLLVLASLIGGWELRETGFEYLARDARRLTAAIAEHHEVHGEFPRTLDSIPSEVRSGLPEFHYYVGDMARDRYHGNPWVLTLDAGTGFLNWDQFLYYPEQNYPDVGHGGWLRRVGDWAYVHE